MLSAILSKNILKFLNCVIQSLNTWENNGVFHLLLKSASLLFFESDYQLISP